MKVIVLLILSVFASAVYSQSIFLTGNDYCSGKLEVTEKNDHLNVYCKGTLVLANDYDLSDKKSLVINTNSIFLSGSIIAPVIDLNLQALAFKWGVKNHFIDSQADLGFPVDKNVVNGISPSLISNSVITSVRYRGVLLSPTFIDIAEVPLPAGFLLFLSAVSGLFLFKNKA